ncbi:DUF2207 domain-containing protein [Nocardioides jiangxiensis]|uniref:DUF2207 domain-containing protein n=1 Tax=Nocardioides jiangxiensis TaxID=3064524 RepID=A0ABT9B3F3_9ACTN|nr:DUF2207 domain-containing protein [Nocardioides sp. WY-20]MDO7868844.1 DUF2207 domain-containing protein [Nocardioides sp. WY-20]
MRRFFAAYVLGLLLLPALLLAPRWWHDESEAGGSDAHPISRYVADFDVHADGSMAVVERVTVDFRDDGSHGIYRYFDLDDPNAPGLRRAPHDMSVTVDDRRGAHAVVERSTQRHGRFVVYRVGSPDRTLPAGEHTYVLRYTVDDVLLPAGSRSRFYWDLVPGGWQNTIDATTLRVHLPAGIGRVRCTVGWGPGDGCDQVMPGADGDSFTITQHHLWSRTPVTVSTLVDVRRPPLAQQLRPWSVEAERTWGSSREAAALALLLTAAIVLGGGFVVWRMREARPPFPLVAGPPRGVGPAQAAYLLERRFTRAMFAGSLLQAAVAGMITLGRGRKGTWRSRPGTDDWQVDDVVTRRLSSSLGDRDVSFDRSGGARLGGAHRALTQATASWAADSGLLVGWTPPAWLRWSQGVAAGLGLVLAVVVASTGPIVWALPLAAIALLGGTSLLLERGGLAMTTFAIWVLSVCAGAVFVWGALTGHGFASFLTGVGGGIATLGVVTLVGTERPTGGVYLRATPEGREAWSRAGGFRRMLATDSAEARSTFAASTESTYLQWLPYAVAFGCADAWADKFPDVADLVPRVADQADGHRIASDGSARSVAPAPSTDDLVSSLHSFAASGESAIRESIGAFVRTSRLASLRGAGESWSSGSSSSSSSGDGSSSSGGGGFSGGGGGGGGGGGTW